MNPDSQGRRPPAARQAALAFALAFAALAAACASTSGKSRTLAPANEIARCEDERRFDETAFRAWLRAPEIEVRIQAARALGRIGDKTSAALLHESLRDSSAAFREEALFALGQIGAKESISPLIAQCADESTGIRVAAIEALGKIAEEQTMPLLLRFLRDPENPVRAEAALALYRLFSLSASPQKPLAEEDAARRRAEFTSAIREEQDAGTRWRMVFALASFSDPLARAALIEKLQDPEPLCRNFAAWGLDRIPGATEDREPLRIALRDSEDAVATRAALALGKRASPENARALRDVASTHRSFHVRRAAVEALGGMSGLEEAQSASLAALTDGSVTVRAEAALSLVKISGEEEFARLEENAKDPSFLVRGKCAAACTLLPQGKALALLATLISDADVRVASSAASALRTFSSDESRRLAITALAREDLSVRAEAAETLGAIGDATALPALAKAYAASIGHEMDEAREKIRAAIKKLGGEDPDPARESGADRPIGESWIEGIDFPKRKLPCLAEIRTEKGNLLLELFPDEAPKHVENFLTLARSGHFDGTIFHRVVSNWVVQGGDHRGDGWGATSTQGGYLRDEIGRRRFKRGSIGMPKGDARDTGGCQIFVTLLPTPKLDGRYTLFGQVIEGLEILDLLEIGDRILEARLR